MIFLLIKLKQSFLSTNINYIILYKILNIMSSKVLLLYAPLKFYYILGRRKLEMIACLTASLAA